MQADMRRSLPSLDRLTVRPQRVERAWLDTVVSDDAGPSVQNVPSVRIAINEAQRAAFYPGHFPMRAARDGPRPVARGAGRRTVARGAGRPPVARGAGRRPVARGAG